ncbi:MAG TPA: hypothetical protein VGF60_03490 [Xanthobacteraceae bacterium]
MAQNDPWERAAECQRAVQDEADPHRREMLTSLRNLWIALANERGLMTQAELSNQIASIGRIEAALPRGKVLH